MGAFMIFVGIVWIHATRQRWRVIDPPESWWWFDSQAMIKNLFGNRIAIALSYLTGGAGITIGVFILILRLVTLCQKLGYCSQAGQ
jgi:hypothetical protein